MATKNDTWTRSAWSHASKHSRFKHACDQSLVPQLTARSIPEAWVKYFHVIYSGHDELTSSRICHIAHCDVPVGLDSDSLAEAPHFTSGSPLTDMKGMESIKLFLLHVTLMEEQLLSVFQNQLFVSVLCSKVSHKISE